MFHKRSYHYSLYYVLGLLIVTLWGCNPTPNSLGTPIFTVVPSNSPTAIKVAPTKPATPILPTPTATSQVVDPPKASTDTLSLESNSSHDVYIHKFGVGYWALDVENIDDINPIFIDYASPDPIATGPSLLTGPGNALFLAFANAKNRLAYWSAEQPAKLRVADMDYTNSYVLWEDVDRKYEIMGYPFPQDEIHMVWLPGDRYILIDIVDENSLDLLADIKTNTVIGWNYACSTIAKALNTSNWALWCLDKSNRSNFAIVDRDNDISFSTNPPIDVLTNFTANLGPSWSPKGDLLAYFDSSLPENPLTINNQDNDKTATELYAYPLNALQPVLLPPKSPVSFSSNGHFVLTYADSRDSQACPGWKNPFAETETLNRVACWHVVEVDSGKVIWSLNNSASSLAEANGSQDVVEWSYHKASISPDGSTIILGSKKAGLNLLSLIDVESSKVLFTTELPVDNIQWGFKE